MYNQCHEAYIRYIFHSTLRWFHPDCFSSSITLIWCPFALEQEHVAEYGVHWNFFFTLAAVALLTSLIHVPTAYCGSLAVVILGGMNQICKYECVVVLLYRCFESLQRQLSGI